MINRVKRILSAIRQAASFDTRPVSRPTSGLSTSRGSTAALLSRRPRRTSGTLVIHSRFSTFRS